MALPSMSVQLRPGGVGESKSPHPLLVVFRTGLVLGRGQGGTLPDQFNISE